MEGCDNLILKVCDGSCPRKEYQYRCGGRVTDRVPFMRSLLSSYIRVVNIFSISNSLAVAFLVINVLPTTFSLFLRLPWSFFLVSVVEDVRG